MLNSLAEEFSHEAPVAIDILLVRLVGAAILSGLIGLEREFRNNSAGLRTNMLIGLAAAVFALIGLQLMHEFANQPNTVQFDPIRLIEAITAGIAFLAAGVIIHTRGDVRGLTTGASMWLSGAIGLCVGLGMWVVAAMATGAGIVILWLLRKTEVAAGTKEN
ncbi:MgtC/SapB family protein [Rhizobium puerariae]|uniref:Protein MgtC n=1 Tax=Rhizobium puerariae TaxID=1585791 RepID=A0ABV6AM88_9HYPH